MNLKGRRSASTWSVWLRIGKLALHQLRTKIYREIVAEAQARLEPRTGQSATGGDNRAGVWMRKSG
jgi:hypothetical protein